MNEIPLTRVLGAILLAIRGRRYAADDDQRLRLSTSFLSNVNGSANGLHVNVWSASRTCTDWRSRNGLLSTLMSIRERCARCTLGIEE
jgi:hypothetical protein